jgi:hypothetical protein
VVGVVGVGWLLALDAFPPQPIHNPQITKLATTRAMRDIVDLRGNNSWACFAEWDVSGFGAGLPLLAG